MAAWRIGSTWWCSAPAAAATPVLCARRSSASPSAWSRRTRSAGTCLHRGCIPTKAILHAAEVADAAREGAQFGIHATIDKIDLAGVRGYADGVVGRLYKGLSGLIAGRGITVVPGEGRLSADRLQPGSRGRRPSPSRRQSRAGLRLVRPKPPRPGDRRRTHPDQRSRPPAGAAAGVGHRARRRCHRLRVRVGLALFRGRGDRGRGPPPAAACRGTRHLRRAGTGIPQAQDHHAHRRSAARGGRHRGRGSCHAARGPHRRGRAAAGGGRPRTAVRRAGLCRGRHRAGARLSSR